MFRTYASMQEFEVFQSEHLEWEIRNQSLLRQKLGVACLIPDLRRTKKVNGSLVLSLVLTSTTLRTF